MNANIVHKVAVHMTEKLDGAIAVLVLNLNSKPISIS